MKKLLGALFGIALIVYLLGPIGPWWLALPISAAVASLMNLKARDGLIAGFLACSFIWILQAWSIDSSNASILSDRIGNLIGLSSLILILLTGLLGGITGALGGLFGALVRQAFSNSDQQN